MRDRLAELLLAKVMDWSAEDISRERPILQDMATYKYDEYQQFSPGMRFVESLALWLYQFKTPSEKRTAYDFVKSRLVFVSAAELRHLVSMAYQDFVRPHLLQQVAKEKGICPYHVGKVASIDAFKIRQRQCLFLGLSDGARTDIFRRCNTEDISHEQVLMNHEVSPERISKLISKLKEELTPLFNGNVPQAELQFRTIVLLDDFSGSGLSYLRRENDGKFTGKIQAFHSDFLDPATNNNAGKLVNLSTAQILLILYVGTDQARLHLEARLKELWEPLGVNYRVIMIHTLNNEIRLVPGDPIELILNNYYDQNIEDEHTRKGGKDLKFGFAGCGLPIVLSHNTPNNSIYLLWAEHNPLRALFPRIQRHRKHT